MPRKNSTNSEASSSEAHVETQLNVQQIERGLLARERRKEMASSLKSRVTAGQPGPVLSQTSATAPTRRLAHPQSGPTSGQEGRTETFTVQDKSYTRTHFTHNAAWDQPVTGVCNTVVCTLSSYDFGELNTDEAEHGESPVSMLGRRIMLQPGSGDVRRARNTATSSDDEIMIFPFKAVQETEAWASSEQKWPCDKVKAFQAKACTGTYAPNRAPVEESSHGLTDTRSSSQLRSSDNDCNANAAAKGRRSRAGRRSARAKVGRVRKASRSNFVKLPVESVLEIEAETDLPRKKSKSRRCSLDSKKSPRQAKRSRSGSCKKNMKEETPRRQSEARSRSASRYRVTPFPTRHRSPLRPAEESRSPREEQGQRARSRHYRCTCRVHNGRRQEEVLLRRDPPKERKPGHRHRSPSRGSSSESSSSPSPDRSQEKSDPGPRSFRRNNNPRAPASPHERRYSPGPMDAAKSFIGRVANAWNKAGEMRDRTSRDRKRSREKRSREKRSREKRSREKRSRENRSSSNNSDEVAERARHKRLRNGHIPGHRRRHEETPDEEPRESILMCRLM